MESLEDRIFKWCVFLILLAFILACLASCSAAVPLGAMAPIPITDTPTVSVVAQGRDNATLPTPTPSTCTVQTGVPSGRLNLRKGAGTQYPVIGVLEEGDVLTVLADGDWLAVMVSDGTRGYINSRFCR